MLPTIKLSGPDLLEKLPVFFLVHYFELFQVENVISINTYIV